MDGLFTRLEGVEAEVHEVSLSRATESERQELSAELGIGLSPEEMGRVADHFAAAWL